MSKLKNIISYYGIYMPVCLNYDNIIESIISYNILIYIHTHIYIHITTLCSPHLTFLFVLFLL